jgi:formylmethanofuran dehydrogenase subunit B
MTTTVDGHEATLPEALDRAARLLAAARLPLVAGLGTDVAGARAALALAERLGGAVDHMGGAAIARDLGVLAEAGLLSVTPGEARSRADVIVLAGDLGRCGAWLADVFGPGPSPIRGNAPPREVIAIGAAKTAAGAIAGAELVETLAAPSLPPVLAALKARVGGHRVDAERLGRGAARSVERAAERLKAARYGVLVWDAARLDAVSIELLAGLVKDLNGATRFAALPFPGEDNAMGVALTAAWTTGFPLRVGFRGGVPVHDPWAFDADRLVASGEADALLWISALSATPPPWREPPPTIALVAPGTRLSGRPAVAIEVAEPGVAHAAALFDAKAGAIIAAGPIHAGKAAKGEKPLPAVSAVLAGILERVPAGEGA